MDAETIDNLSKLVYRMEGGAAVLLCLTDAMTRNVFAADAYAPAAQLAHDLYAEIIADLRRLIKQNQKGTGE